MNPNQNPPVSDAAKAAAPTPLPCPFCGGKAKQSIYGGTPKVECEDCGVYTMNEDALPDWNTRDTTAITAATAPLEKEYQRIAELYNREATAHEETQNRLLARVVRLETALKRIARPHDCGCKPCTGQCMSEEALKITLDEIRNIAREALSDPDPRIALAESMGYMVRPSGASSVRTMASKDGGRNWVDLATIDLGPAPSGAPPVDEMERQQAAAKDFIENTIPAIERAREAQHKNPDPIPFKEASPQP